ncbi:hypothetical protein L6654_08545 [Bradyrhizobium sp. WYCCWR 13023]|uniref:Uncharacterized protein n=1 Tax=Bradyrhizobium zhengyangense TaxID=2911009 RepID=A0A9X1U8R3_9BRAD|nr:hypothetical protein [Bradyrhizobium zhengyangense]MCG2626669.1 hypothetical protein [Bradyrhizobium zhengyangense]
MGKRFVPVRDADARALELCLKIREVEQMPLIKLIIRKDSKRPITFGERDGDLDRWWSFTIDEFLRLDVSAAKAKGGTAFHLQSSSKKRPQPRIPQSEIDRGVEQFFLGKDDE